jgi:hypothetical protein
MTAMEDEDIGNTEAWAEIVEDLLCLVPMANRMQVLQLAVTKEKAEIAERATEVDLEKMQDTPGLRHWDAIMALKSLVIQVFTRDIVNNHSAADAAKILFAKHRYGRGSRCLSDYIDDLPRANNMEN